MPTMLEQTVAWSMFRCPLPEPPVVELLNPSYNVPEVLYVHKIRLSPDFEALKL